MASGRSNPARWNRLLSQAVRAIRRRSGLRTAEVAVRMNMPLRSYEHFEAGGGRVSLERIHDFAAATDSDPTAILVALLIGSPEFAVRCSRNKMMMTLMLALQEFDEDIGNDIELVETGAYLTRFSEVFTSLAKEAGQRRDLARAVAQRGRTAGFGRPDQDDDEP